MNGHLAKGSDWPRGGCPLHYPTLSCKQFGVLVISPMAAARGVYQGAIWEPRWLGESGGTVDICRQSIDERAEVARAARRCKSMRPPLS